MNELSERPDPEALLRRAHEEEQRASQGKLRIFFGFAPGVGKTYRMLQAARELLQVQHVDVVAGVVETHQRPETAALLDAIPLLPLRTVEHRGTTLRELDLDAALARKPKVILIDELAHTNVPGSRHPKRWQDVFELLDAGIDVLSTMNVQHVESLNDVIAQITHVQVRERVPDAVLERADAIELVDLSPEELLQRLKEGKVYLPDQAERAAEHFFRRGNLLALRELALRRTAQHVDEEVLQYRAEHRVAETWPTGERILVCIGPSPGSARLLRSARRMAAGLHAEWVAAYVDVTGMREMSRDDRARLESNLQLAESLGAKVVRLQGARISDALLAYARKHNVSRIVLGKPTHPRLRDRLRGSLLDEVVRGSLDVDVLVIAGEEATEREPPLAERPQAAIRPARYAGAASLVAITTALAVGVHRLFELPDVEVLYFVAIMLAAMRFGRQPALAAAALSVAAYDFFFVPPNYTFAVADVRYVLTFAMMFGVGLVLSTLTARLRREERAALLREERTAALYALSRDLGAAQEVSAAAQVIARHASALLARRAAVLCPDAQGTLELLATAPEPFTLDASDQGVAHWALQRGRSAGLGTDSLPGAASLASPLRSTREGKVSVLGVLVLLPADREPLDAEQRALLDAFASQAALAIERAHLAEQARTHALRAKTDEVRGALLSAVSHDLRTPLAAITGAASSLREDKNLDEPTRRELLVSISDEAERLERLVANLLDMTRIDSGAVSLKREWVPLEELVGAALTQLEARLTGRPVLTDLPADLPLCSVDPVLFERVLVNVLENAAKYTPREAPIDITARSASSAVQLCVADRGPGFLPGTEERVFEKFFRGTHVGVRGIGLGLAICRWIVEAHGGSIRARNREGGGAEIAITLPVPSQPPSWPSPTLEPPSAT